MAMIITVRCLEDRQKLIDTLTNAYGNERVIYCRYHNGERETPSSSAMWLSEESFPFTAADHELTLHDFVRSKCTRIVQSLAIMTYAMESNLGPANSMACKADTIQLLEAEAALSGSG